MTDRKTDRQTDRGKGSISVLFCSGWSISKSKEGRQIDRQTVTQTDRQTDRVKGSISVLFRSGWSTSKSGRKKSKLTILNGFYCLRLFLSSLLLFPVFPFPFVFLFFPPIFSLSYLKLFRFRLPICLFLSAFSLCTHLFNVYALPFYASWDTLFLSFCFCFFFFRGRFEFCCPWIEFWFICLSSLSALSNPFLIMICFNSNKKNATCFSTVNMFTWCFSSWMSYSFLQMF